MQKIVPFLWFDDRLEEAVSFYSTVFVDAKVVAMSRYAADVGPIPKGTVMSAEFELAGQRFMGLNGGPAHRFTPAVSFLVRCETQGEVDRYWAALLADGGSEQPCGWLQDKFGLSWQIIPDALPRLLGDPRTAGPVMQAMMTMTKIDIAALERAAAG